MPVERYRVQGRTRQETRRKTGTSEWWGMEGVLALDHPAVVGDGPTRTLRSKAYPHMDCLNAQDGHPMRRAAQVMYRKKETVV
jgi:hypothetical protein